MRKAAAFILTCLLCVMLRIPSISLAEHPAMIPGTYTGTADGRNGPIAVEVKVGADAIQQVTVTNHQENAIHADLPIARIPETILRHQSLGVDVISGATLTSRGIIQAVTHALMQAGADVDALCQVAVTQDALPTADLETDILVVGSGMAGLVAANTALEKGADVILVEKLDQPGGTLLLSGGYMLRVDDGEPDQLEGLLRYYREVNGDSIRQPDYEFFASIAGQTGDTADYLTHHIGIPLGSFDAGIHQVSYHPANGAGLARDLIDTFTARGGRLITGTKATRIWIEEGAATGVGVENRSGAYTIHARKVIIATGGSSHDAAALIAANPALAGVHIRHEASIGATGDGAHMLAAIGARMGDGPFIKSYTPTFPANFRMDAGRTPYPGDQLIVDSEGRRFANEYPLQMFMLNTYMLRHSSPACYVVYDAAHTDPSLLEKIREQAAGNNRSIAVFGETVESLAAHLEMDADVLRTTYDTYQAACKSGVDEAFGKEKSHLIPYDEANGLYAVRLIPTSLGTIGGVETDDSFRVLDASGSVIPNLFAAGEVAAGAKLFGDYYVGSFSLGLYSAAGKIAAETAVGEMQGLE